jgi:hypothetical protein
VACIPFEGDRRRVFHSNYVFQVSTCTFPAVMTCISKFNVYMVLVGRYCYIIYTYICTWSWYNQDDYMTTRCRLITISHLIGAQAT